MRPNASLIKLGALARQDSLPGSSCKVRHPWMLPWSSQPARRMLREATDQPGDEARDECPRPRPRLRRRYAAVSRCSPRPSSRS